MNKFALCVGINDYPGTGSDLSGCINDCNDWMTILATKQYQITTLHNDQATKAGMVNAFVDLLNKAGDGDHVVFTYSGHGTWVPDLDGDEDDGKDEAIVPYDVDKEQLILDDELALLLANHRKPTTLVTLLFDCCHSGTMTRALPMLGNPAKIRFLPPWQILKSAKYTDKLHEASEVPPTMSPWTTIKRAAVARAISPVTPSVVMVAGCRDAEYSYDANFGGRPNGAFTYYAVQTLKKMGNPTFQAWYREIRKHLPGGTYQQTPQLVCAKHDCSLTVLP